VGAFHRGVLLGLAGIKTGSEIAPGGEGRKKKKTEQRDYGTREEEG